MTLSISNNLAALQQAAVFCEENLVLGQPKKGSVLSDPDKAGLKVAQLEYSAWLPYVWGTKDSITRLTWIQTQSALLLDPVLMYESAIAQFKHIPHRTTINQSCLPSIVAATFLANQIYQCNKEVKLIESIPDVNPAEQLCATYLYALQIEMGKCDITWESLRQSDRVLRIEEIKKKCLHVIPFSYTGKLIQSPSLIQAAKVENSVLGESILSANHKNARYMYAEKYQKMIHSNPDWGDFFEAPIQTNRRSF